MAKHGNREIFDADKGRQFTSGHRIDALTGAKIKISMPLGGFANHLPEIDGKGARRENQVIERLWRSLKFESVYLHAFERGSEAKADITKWLASLIAEHPHSTRGILTPNEAYPSKYSQ